jgi:alpha-glucosidase
MLTSIGGAGRARPVRGGALVTCKRGSIRIEAVRDGVMRLRVAATDGFPKRGTGQVAPGTATGGGLKVSGRSVTAGGLRVEFADGSFRILGRGGREVAAGELLLGPGRAGCRLAMRPDARYYGFGEKAGKLEKRGTRMTMWNSDIFGAEMGREMDPFSTHPDPLYASIPFFIEHRAGRAAGFFLDTGRRSDFDLGMDDGETCGFSVREGGLDLYVIDGPEMSDVVRRYTELTGRLQMPPLWALGYHQCRWSYPSEKRVREVARTMRRSGVPCDAIWLDIDYMNGFRIFTFDRKRFPRPRRLMEDLATDGFRTVAIVDPGLKADPDWEVYREGLRKGCFVTQQGKVYRGRVWPGDTVFPDFRRPEVAEWFGRLCSEFADRYGLAGLWFDMNEPSDQKGQWHGPAHEACGNLYAHRELAGAAAVWDRAHPGARRFFLTRSASAGSQRHSAIWTGDNVSKFDHIGMSLSMSANLGLSGFPFVGSDVGGFSGNCDGELLARWTQYGALTPFFRNHACSGTPDQEPWAFGPKVLAVCREYTRLRYRLLPYIYSAFRQAVETGAPVQRPMIYSFPRDERFTNEARQFMLGDHLLVAPVLERGATRKAVVLPAGRWVDFHTGEVLDGGRTVRRSAPLETMPIFVRAGAAIPMWRPAECTDRIDSRHLRVECFPGGEARTELYQDDGATRDCENGVFGKVLFRTRERRGERVLARGRTDGPYRVPGRRLEVVFVGCAMQPRSVWLRAGRSRVKLVPKFTRRRGEVAVVVPDLDAGFEIVLRGR